MIEKHILYRGKKVKIGEFPTLGLAQIAYWHCLHRINIGKHPVNVENNLK